MNSVHRFAILALGGLSLIFPSQGEAAVSGTIDLNPPTPPKGFESRQAVMAAIFKKELDLIQTDFPVPNGVKEVKAVEYGRAGNRSLLLDLYLPEKPDPNKPSLIFIHGGAWSGGSRDVYKYYTVHFAQRGYASATISYRLSGEAPFPAAVNDSKGAVRWMRAKAGDYGFNAKNIVAIGGSAGGHLSLMLGYTPRNRYLEGKTGHADESSAVQAVINFYGPVDLTTKMGQESGSVRKFLDGIIYQDNPQLYRDASPLHYLKEGAPPTLIIHGTLDETVKIAQGDALANKLASLNLPYAYARLDGWPHTLDAAKVVNSYCTTLMESFLRKTFITHR